MTDEEIKRYIDMAIENAILKYKSESCECKLEDVGVDLKTHLKHHTEISSFLEFGNSIKKSTINTIIGILVTAVIGILWLGFRGYVK